MAVCDVCGVEYDYPGETISLYSAKLIERKVIGKRMSTRRVSSEYNQITPVSVTVCRRHHRELITQRIMPGIIVFVIFMIPVMFIISRFYHFEGDSLIILYGISIVISLFLMSWVLTLISLEGLVATALTIRDKRKGLGVEYLTEKKYRRVSGPPNPGLIGWSRSLLSGRKVEPPARSQPASQKLVHKSKK